MSLLDELLGRIFWNGAPLTRRGRMNFLGTAVSSIVDNEETGATDVTLSGPMGTLPTPGADGEILTSDGTEWASEPFPFGSPVSVGSANADGNAVTASRSDHVHNHGALAGGDRHAVATESVAGFMSADDKAKLDGLEGGSSSDAWPSCCALVFDFTKPATVAIHSSITTGDLASGYRVSPEGEISPYTTIGAPSGNDYPVHVIDDGAGSHFVEMEAVVEGRPGYKVIRVCAEAAHHSWIFVDSVSGVAAGAYFNLATGAVGTTGGLDFLAAEATSDGDGGYVCDILVDGPANILVRVYVCDADGTPTATGWASGPAIILKQFDRLHGTAGQDVIQKTVERIDSIGSRRATCAWQDENEESQPPLFDGYTPLLPTAGALFAGDHVGLGIDAKRLRILDPAGAYDLVRQLSAPGAGWTLYIVCTLPDDDAAERILFHLGAATTREVSAFFYDGDVILRDRNGGTICSASIAQPVGAGVHLFAFYYGGGTLRVGADDLLGSIVSNGNICAEPFTVATLGGSGHVPFVPTSECRAIMQIAIFVPERCDPLSTDDTAIRAKLATDFSVTTLLGT